ncbi:MAG TPA: UDP-N-acetylmuramoyl-tripeptide--D-alanyl-D-alanine ligase, partial [Lysobacter sp.]|nr:UDP-N-acetylmuramoyl-tripeptide--D-alanyl-D-alanine ligase [Lysobacter sp.]
MKRLQLSDIARMTGGRLHGEDLPVDALATDTRALPGGGAALFVALKGGNFDGHDHVVAAARGGVAAALVSRLVDADMPQVLVADTERALGDLAAAVQRDRHTAVAAITGSNGKTSVKALLLEILVRAGSTYANPGNRNNEIGLPLAVLDAPEDARYAVYEMGAGKPGDIAYLTAIARPDVALVNNIAPAHLERMGSLLGVADTKAAIYDALPPQGVAVINADDAFAPYFAERAHGRRLIRFGLEATADIRARDIVATAGGSRFGLVTPAGEVAIELSLRGRHNVRNALAAASLALALGVSLDAIAQGLNAARPVAGRLVAHELDNGAVLIDDSYNANPGSLAAAIDTLAES